MEAARKPGEELTPEVVLIVDQLRELHADIKIKVGLCSEIEVRRVRLKRIAVGVVVKARQLQFDLLERETGREHNQNRSFPVSFFRVALQVLAFDRRQGSYMPPTRQRLHQPQRQVKLRLLLELRARRSGSR